jgi:hypothetical protein
MIMKSINTKDITEVPAKDVKPGHVVLEGVILDARAQTDKRGKVMCYFFDTAAGTAVYAEPDQQVQVFAKVTREMVKAIQESMERDRAAV